MGLFKKRKKKQKQLDMEEFLHGARPEPRAEPSGKKQVEHQAIEYCEQIMEAARELEESKKEYRLVTSYLSDVQIIEELPAQQMRKLQEIAQNIGTLLQSKERYGTRDKRISDAQFMQMDQLQDDMPQNIRRLQTNEKYQAVVKRDMNHLEGEKGSISYRKESLRHQQKILRIVIIAVVVIFVSVMILLAILQSKTYRDMGLYFLLATFFAALSGGGAFIKMLNNQTSIKKSEANINRAITLLNQTKAKYVNVTNAVDYVCEKFHVNNGMELTYVWELYQKEVKERKELAQTNEDLEYFNNKLVRELKTYQLYDAAIWINQTNAIMDKKELVEVKHYLLVRRQKLRARIESQIDAIQGNKKKVQILLKDKKEYRKEIMDVLKTVDKMCGVG